MKTTFISLLIITFSMTAMNAQTYIADLGNSKLKWYGEKVTGDHYGFINLKSGSMEIKDDRIVWGKFVIDMTSITNSDLSDAGYNTKLVNHLKSDDFFGVQNHPEAHIEIVKSSRFINNEVTVDAQLTIKNITHPITFMVKRDGMAYHAEIVVDRSKYNVRYGSGSFFDNLGNNLIYDEFTMTVNVMMKESTKMES